MLIAPASGADFFTALNRKLVQLRGLTEKCWGATQSSGQSEVKLRELGQSIAALAWLLPVPRSTTGAEIPASYEALTDACEAFNKAVEFLVAGGFELRGSLQVIAKLTGWLRKADQTAQARLVVPRVGLRYDGAYAWSAMLVAGSFVPVLGDFYSKALVGAPAWSSG